MAGSRWIRNDVYDQTVKAKDISRVRRMDADNKVSMAKDELNRTKNQTGKQIADDKKRAVQAASQANKAVENFEARAEELKEEFQKEIGKQNLWYREQIDAVRQEVGMLTGKVNMAERRLADLKKEYDARWQSMMSKIASKKSRAQIYRSQLNHTLSEIAKLHPDKLAPGEAELLGNGLAYVTTNIKNEDYEAAISTAQVKLLDAANLQARLELLNDEYQQVMDEIGESQRGIQKSFTDMEIPEKYQKQLEGTQFMFDGRIPFWSDGLFELCRQQYEERCAQIKEEADAMHIEALQMQKQKLVRVNAQLDICVQSAEKEFLESCYVQSLAVRICEVLNKYDWELLDSGFAKEDERRSYSMSYGDGSGKTASFVILPERELVRWQKVKDQPPKPVYGEAKFQVEVYAGDGIENRTGCERTKNAVLAQLAHHGIRQNEDENRKAKTVLPENAEAFIQKVTAEADKIKNTRITTARNQMQI